MDVPFHIHTCTLKYTTLKYNIPPPHPKKKKLKKTMFLNKQEKSRFFFQIFYEIYLIFYNLMKKSE